MTRWTDIADHITQATGESFCIEQQSPVAGGCINSAYLIKGSGQRFFVKLNSSDLLEMFIAEAEGLQEMSRSNAICVPDPVCYGTSGNQAYLVLQALELASAKPGTMQRFGEQLATMHQHTGQQFGWHRDNTIGSTQQKNERKDDWVNFWREQRLGFQLQLAKGNGASHRLLNKGEQLQANLEFFFSSYKPQASLLHGDLWSGNYAINSRGEAVIFDPAVYYGDREADLAMTELFGGFGADFYSAYNNCWSLDEGYKIRKTLYNLYHILNHFNLFGGGYAAQAEAMMDRLLSEV